MHFHFLLSGPHGDRELSPADLAQRFLLSPDEPHPFLSLEDYFGALQKFLLLDDGKLLSSALIKRGLPPDTIHPDISEVVIRSEKHGALYHIASVEIPGLGENSKLAVTSALSGSARRSLQEEYGILRQLSSIAPEHLPQLYCRETVSWETDRGGAQFFMVLGEWLDGYHEWHATEAPEAGKQKVQLWDYEKGSRFLADTESFELLRQAAYILTCFYDQASFCQIYPWHHGAGDFIVRPEPGALSVKLITARQYAPLVYFDGEEEADRLVAAIHFLLNLGLRIRMDRFDGVGAPAWLDEFAVQAAVAGFFAGLGAAATTNRLRIGPVADFLEIMQSFDARELVDMYGSLLQIYADEDPDDFHLIQARLPGHAAELQKALQHFSLKKP